MHKIPVDLSNINFEPNYWFPEDKKAYIHNEPLKSIEKEPENVLQEANRLVNGPRRLDYGHPLDDYTRTAKMWSAILGHYVSAEQAALCMIAVKLSRQCNAPKRDNLVDAAGYAWVAQEIVDERKRREAKEETNAGGTTGPSPFIRGYHD